MALLRPPGVCSNPPLGYQYTVFESAPTTASAKASALTPQTALPTDCAAVGKPTVKQLPGNTRKPLRYGKVCCTKSSKCLAMALLRPPGVCSNPPLGYQYTVFESAPTTASAKASALTPQTALPTDCAAVGKPTVKGNTRKPLRYGKVCCTKSSKYLAIALLRPPGVCSNPPLGYHYTVLKVRLQRLRPRHLH